MACAHNVITPVVVTWVETANAIEIVADSLADEARVVRLDFHS